MFSIRRVHDDIVPRNRLALLEVQRMLREQFPALDEAEVTGIPEKLRNPFKYRFRSILYVAEDGRGVVQGFAVLMHAPDLAFCYLDFISSARRFSGRGVGAALYEAVRHRAAALESIGLFFECLPDDPALSPDPAVRRQNAARLRFYEHWGARPVTGTRYETPVTPGDHDPPYLVFDDLGSGKPLRRPVARAIARAILERKYGELCPADYTDAVVASFTDDPVRLRPPRYVKEPASSAAVSVPPDRRIALVVTDRHEIHHVHERGYVESPVRIRSILRELTKGELVHLVPPRHFGERYLLAVHDHGYVAYFKRVCDTVAEGKSVYPYVFPIRNGRRPPREVAVRAGYYCIDTFTPLNRHAFAAATRAVDCALTAAQLVLDGSSRIAYALVRPPGHHAERRSFGGFCYFNSAAVAAAELSRHGRVAMLDIDYHHGNGQQDIFWRRGDILTVSIHGHPRFAYPYFSGFADERGEGDGTGANLNIPLPEQLDGAGYREALDTALRRVRRFAPQFLVLSLGLDTAKGDPTGSWSLTAADFEANGWMIGELRLPTLVVQEGGYDTRHIGGNARRFLTGLLAGAESAD